MSTLYTHHDSNIRKTWFLMTTFVLVVIAIGWAFSWYIGNPSILYAAVGFSLLMNVGSYWFSHRLVLSMAGAREMPDEGPFREIHNMVENLAITAGLPKPQLFVIDDPAPNAFATGRNPEHAVVAVTTGLMQILDRSEMEGVLAHELSHIGNRDMLVSTVAVVLVGFVSILADFFLRLGLSGAGDRDRGRATIVLVIVGIVAAILAPIAAKLIHLAISRKREFLADASGALLTRYPEGLASALQKISAHGQQMVRAHHATAHLFIANPFADNDGRTSFMERINGLFSTHPPVAERIAALTQKK
jgi:heat shock protein HtpX